MNDYTLPVGAQLPHPKVICVTVIKTGSVMSKREKVSLHAVGAYQRRDRDVVMYVRLCQINKGRGSRTHAYMYTATSSRWKYRRRYQWTREWC